MAEEYDIGKAFEVIEDELIASMIRNMKRHRAEELEKGYEWSQWQVEQLKALEKYKKHNQKKYQKQFRSINAKIEALIRIAKQEGGMAQETTILQAIKNGFTGYHRAAKGMMAEFFRLNERKLDALIHATLADVQKAEIAILRMADDKYRKTIYNAQVYANTGAGTYEKAVDMATKDMLAAGLNCVEYTNGARHRLAVYADMTIRTACKRAYLQGEGEKRMEWGVATVIMNKRGNPCPKCLPFVGKVLIDDVWSGGSSEDGDYPLMSKAIAAGLYHPNCRDSHTTYFPGISTADDTWTKAELEAVEKAYQKSQRRQYCRHEAKKYDRLAKYSLDEENQRVYGKRTSDWKGQIKMPEFLSVRNWEKTDIDTMMRIENELSLVPDTHQDILKKAGIDIVIQDESNSFYDPIGKTINLVNDFEDYEIIHEIAHALEDVENIWQEPEFRKLVETISNEHNANDIFDDITTFTKTIRRLEDKRFVSEYQGRVYSTWGEILPNGKINPDSLWDYFSEGYRCFLEAPEVLLEKDPDLYMYIKRWIDG